MRRLISLGFAAGALLSLLIGACAPGAGSGGEGSTSTPTTSGDLPSASTTGGELQGDGKPPSVLTIHFKLDDPQATSDNYTTRIKKRFYVWVSGLDGHELTDWGTFDAQGHDYRIAYTFGWEEDFGIYITVYPTDPIFPNHDKFMFIIKDQGTWAGQSEDTPVSYFDFPKDEDGKMEVWSANEEANKINVYAHKDEAMGDYLTSASFKDWRTIACAGTGRAASYRLYVFTTSWFALDAKERPDRESDYLALDGVPEVDANNKFTIALDADARPEASYVIKVVFERYPSKVKTKAVGMEPLYDTPKFDAVYCYDGNDLGATWHEDHTDFKLWAPTSSLVRLRIYEDGTPSYLHPVDVPSLYNAFDEYPMALGPGGVWSARLEGNFEGLYYTYVVDNAAGHNEVCDPYARATGSGGKRAEILDLGKTNPDGWSDFFAAPWDKHAPVGGIELDIGDPTELTPYEVHIRDLTMHPSWNGDDPDSSFVDKLAGTYLGFVKEGTSYTTTTADGSRTVTVKTGFDHLKELGVNAVEILPFFGVDNDERGASRMFKTRVFDANRDDPEKLAELLRHYGTKFNWGYNPQNYNAPDGIFSTDSADGALTVRECKTMILKLAQAGIRVIMDVVYNHVSSVASNDLNLIVPKYYFRLTSKGFYADGSGCGNEFKSESTMGRKFILDSVLYWAREYGVKGFRFDLMGLLDTETMRMVKDALYDVDHDFVSWGEGWQSFNGYNGRRGTHGSDSKHVYGELAPTSSSPGILGCFNDAGRDAIRGNNDGGWGSDNPYPNWGFISKGKSDVADYARQVGRMIQGINDRGSASGDPRQTVTYASCHDNYTVFDQLNYCLGPGGYDPKADAEPDPREVAKASAAVHGAVMFSQGISFIQGGEELFRSKVQEKPGDVDYDVIPYDHKGQKGTTDDVAMYGYAVSHNSYRSSDKVNAFDYGRLVKIKYHKTGKYVDVQRYSEAFREMIAARKKLTQVGKPHNTDTGFLSVWGTENGSTAIGTYVKKDADHHHDIVFFLAGRNKGDTLSFTGGAGATLIFNSLGTGGYSISGDNITLEKYQFVAFAL